VNAMLIRPNNAPNFCFEAVEADRRKKRPESLLFIQTDWDYAGLASMFGWVPCECGFTDGTVDCQHRKVGDMLAEAFDYLCEYEGEIIQWEHEPTMWRYGQ
jgi:hypothetical protein